MSVEAMGEIHKDRQSITAVQFQRALQHHLQPALVSGALESLSEGGDYCLTSLMAWDGDMQPQLIAPTVPSHVAPSYAYLCDAGRVSDWIATVLPRSIQPRLWLDFDQRNASPATQRSRAQCHHIILIPVSYILIHNIVLTPRAVTEQVFAAALESLTNHVVPLLFGEKLGASVLGAGRGGPTHWTQVRTALFREAATGSTDGPIARLLLVSSGAMTWPDLLRYALEGAYSLLQSRRGSPPAAGSAEAGISGISLR
jgi:hypothetical protein